MVPAHWLRLGPAGFASEPCSVSWNADPVLFSGFLPLGKRRVPDSRCMDGCSDGGGSGIIEAEELGPVCNHRIAMLGARKCDAAHGHPWPSRKISTAHGIDDGFLACPHAAARSIGLPGMDRVGDVTPHLSRDPVFPGDAEAGFHFASTIDCARERIA